MKKLILSLSLLFTISSSVHARIAKEGYFIKDPARKFLPLIKSHPALIIDHVSPSGYELYGPTGLREWLLIIDAHFLGLRSEEAKFFFSEYPTPEEIESKLENLAETYSDILKLEKIGKSYQGRPLLMMKISDNPDDDELEPEVKYIANMHGDEIVGRELMVSLIGDLAKKYVEGDSDIKKLIDNTEIFIMASMNPDGAAAQRRSNSQWVDLNRDFPDFSTRDNINNPNGRGPETQAVMNWQKNRTIALSTNFHGGAEVVNYPWDTIADAHPFHELVKSISKDYADKIPDMRNSRRFPGGITNGYAWYEVNGGMQDWSYYWHGDLQLTVELSNTKWPSYSSVKKYYHDNYPSLVNFLKTVHRGAGFSWKSNNFSNKSTKSTKGQVQIKRISSSGNETLLGIFPYQNDEFFKVLEVGQYKFYVTRNTGETKSITTSVDNNIQTNGNYHLLEY